jgi:PAS domain S-box-containing protein
LSAQQNVVRDDAITVIRFPVRLLTLVCLLTLIASVWFGWIILDAQIRRGFDEDFRHDQRHDLLAIIGAMAVGGTSLVAWLSAAHGVRRWRAVSLDSFNRRAEAEENLQTAHAELEVRIRKRTAELANANESLQAENTERERAQETLRESEEKFRQLADNISDVFWITTPDLKETHYVSPAYEHVWGRSAARLYEYPQEWAEAILPEDRERTFAAFGTLAAGEPTVTTEFRIARPDGDVRWIQSRGFQVRDSTGNLIRITGVASDITERKEAEGALRQSEERYRRLFESNPSPMWVYDLETLSFLAVNDSAIRHYGYSQDEFLAMTLKDIRPAEDISDLVADLSQRTGTDDLHNLTQWRHRKKDGALIDVEITSHELLWLGRRAKLALINDITERKRAEKHLAQMEGRYRGLLEAAPDAMVVVNQGGEIVLLNLQAEKQFGYRRDELVGQKVKNIIPKGFAERLVADDLRSAEDALAQQIGTGIELTGRRKNGSDFPIEIMLSPLESADGILVTAAIRDITERKRAEDRLRQQARLLNLAHDAIMVRDMDDRVEFWNHGAEELYGWTAAETQGRKASSFLYQEEPASTAAARAAVIENGKWTGECRHNCKDGGTITVRSGWTLVRDELAAPKSILIINTDVTEQKKLETHLLRAQRLESMGTLASGVAHDLNNILTPILMCTEAIKGNPLKEDLPALFSMIEESARRGANVVKQVLTFARGIEGERVVIKPTHLIQEMIEIAQKTFPKIIEIVGRYPDDLWSIEGDPTQLHQVLLNLSVNARDAMPNGGSLSLGAENFNVDENYASMMPGAKPGPHVMLRVTDTGGGMPRAVIDKIFDPFFTTKEVGKGTGLGLSTTLGIVKSHSGFISVYSEPGKGTTFKVFLPATTIQEDLQQSKASVVPVQGNGELILVVDDEPNILGITRMILEKHKYDVVSANDGPEALAIFAQQMKSISVVLTDLSMPYMDGVALVRSLKKMRPDLSIVASTGQGEQAGLAELQSLGVKNFLTKPYDVPKLLRAVNDALQACG